MAQDPVPVTDEARRRQRRNAIALALVLAALVVIFYLLAIFRIGPAVLDRPL